MHKGIILCTGRSDSNYRGNSINPHPKTHACGEEHFKETNKYLQAHAVRSFLIVKNAAKKICAAEEVEAAVFVGGVSAAILVQFWISSLPRLVSFSQTQSQTGRCSEEPLPFVVPGEAEKVDKYENIHRKKKPYNR